MGEIIIIGSEAIAQGVVTKHELQRWYRPLLPNVHAPRGKELTLRDRTLGAWLWSNREGIITGAAASALHGARWVDGDVPIEMIFNCGRPPRGVVTRNERIADDEVTWVGELPVTTLARTAFDLGRHLPRGRAIARLDALMNANPYSIEDVLLLGKRYEGARGVKQLRARLPLVDGGAASPPETRLRLLYIDAGLPRPTTQIPVYDENGWLVRILDMGWEDFMVASEYDGDQHRTDRPQYVKDVRVMRKLARLGWDVDRVIKEDRDPAVIALARSALIARGWKP
ncbi:hypothetical protein [Mycobacterium hubeiense]|uniref:hypothetical protein n=1 Tax=Mycobacterium hubeiense TaxID=1867256 RepID=UPI000C7EC7B5|nr:hypothetical protein [Mycobacterium sp. QGD 101]